MRADLTQADVAVLGFRLAGVDVVTSGMQGAEPGRQSHQLSLKGPGGEVVMFVFDRSVTEIGARREGAEFWLVDCPLQEHGPFLAQLKAALNHAVDVLVREMPNGDVTWQFAGKFV